MSRPRAVGVQQLTEFAEKHVGYKMWITRLAALGSDILKVAPHPGPSGIDAITTAWAALAPKIDDVRKEVPAAMNRGNHPFRSKASAISGKTRRFVGGSQPAQKNV